MNHINVNQTGGFPLTTNVLQYSQDSAKVLNAFGEMAHPLTILKGCTQTGNNVTDGVVYVDGEVYEFRGGVATPYVVITTETGNDIFEDGSSKTTTLTKYATFGFSGSNGYAWADFYRINTLKSLNDRLTALEAKKHFFKGMIMIWNKAANLIPEGWQEVTDMAGKTIFGHQEGDVDFGTLGQTGGEKKHTLTLNELTPHTHPGTVPVYANRIADSGNNHQIFYPGASASSSAGGGQPFNVLNPYRVVKFIEPITDF